MSFLRFVGFLFTLCSLHAAFAELISTNAGRVGEKIITSREVVISHIIENALFRVQKGRVPKSRIDLAKVRETEFVRETTGVLIETAIYMEAVDLSTDRVSQDKIRSSVQLVRKNVGSDPLWKKLQVDPGELNQVVERKLRAKEHVNFKVQSVTTPVSDHDAQVYFDNNRLKFENLPFASFKENIKSYLLKQQVDQRLKDWFELLQSKYRVRNYLAE